MSRVLITGIAGFIMSHLADKLITNGYEVIGIDDLSGGFVENVNPKAKFYKADCRDSSKMNDIIEKERPSIVFHGSANAAENKAQFSPIDITSRNYDAFIKVLTPFIKYGCKRFIFTSSIAVYGALQTPFKETDTPEPEDLYGITKLAAEQTLKVMSKVHGFEYVIARPHNVYGPRQNMRDPYRNVVTIWMNQLLRGKHLTIYGDGEQERQFSYIHDVVSQLYKCGFEDVSGKTFNLGSEDENTLNHLAGLIMMAAEKDHGVKYLPDRLQEVKKALADHEQANKYLGMCETHITDGLASTWNWCVEQGPQDFMYTDIEIPSDKLPSNWKV